MTGSSSFWFANTGAASFYNNVATQSLRVESGDAGGLSRTVGSSITNRKKFTISAWVKPTHVTGLTSSGSARMFAGFGKSGGNYGQIGFYVDGIYFYEYNGASYLRTTQLFRDRAAWYNIQVIVDTTESTAGDRNKVYVNGSRVTDFSTQTNYSLNYDSNWNIADSSTSHRVGTSGDTGGNLYQPFSGYISDFHFIDGSAVASTNFGELKNGAWIPKEYSGSYGDGGYRLEFKQTGTSANASGIGADTSGNNLHFSVTNYVASDSNIPDSPENNMAILNSLYAAGGTPTFTEGNLKLTGSGTDYDRSFSTIYVTEGKWYAEFYFVSGDDRGMFGIVREDSQYLNAGGASNLNGTYIGAHLNTYGSDCRARAYTNRSQLFDQTNFDTGDIGLLCFDIDNGKLWFGRRDVSGSATIWYDSSGNNNGDPSAGSNPTYTFTATGYTWYIGCHDYNGTTIIANFGQDGSFGGAITSQGASDDNSIGDFNYIESGFLALCTANLSEPTLGPNSDEQPNDHFNAVIYNSTGDGQNITGVGFAPDLVWVRCRSVDQGNGIFDTSRGTGKVLNSDATSAESSVEGVKSFDSDGYTMGNSYNQSGRTFVSWNWKANGGTTPTNDASATGVGNMDSIYQVNSTAKFSMGLVNGSIGSTTSFAHGLGVVPDFFMFKPRGSAGTSWAVYHKDTDASAPEDYYLFLETTGGKVDSASYWNDTAPTSSIIQLGATWGGVTDGYFWAWKSVEGYSKFSFYEGNGNADGPFVHLGFRPRLFVVKRADSTGWWAVSDSARSTKNEISNTLAWNNTYSESNLTSDLKLDFLSNGVKIRDTDGYHNASGGRYVYMAWAEMPQKYSLAF